MTVGCVILAAGQSLRFGGAKLHAFFHGHSLISLAMQAVPKGYCACVVASDPEILQLARAQGFQGVYNDCPEAGISRSIRLGVEAMQAYDALVFLVADQPRLRSESVARLIARWEAEPDKIIRAVHGTQPGNPCIFPRAFYPALLSLTGDRGGSAVIRQNPQFLRTVELPAEELWDCDTPQALEQLAKKEVLP